MFTHLLKIKNGHNLKVGFHIKFFFQSAKKNLWILKLIVVLIFVLKLFCKFICEILPKRLNYIRNIYKFFCKNVCTSIFVSINFGENWAQILQRVENYQVKIICSNNAWSETTRSFSNRPQLRNSIFHSRKFHIITINRVIIYNPQFLRNLCNLIKNTLIFCELLFQGRCKYSTIL